SYEVVDKILQSKKSAGEKFGRVRDKLAECLGVSSSQVKKIQNIDKNAIEPVKTAIENGELSIHTADKIAKLEKDKQKEIAQSGLNNLKPKDITKKESEKCDTNTTFSEDDISEYDETTEETDIDFVENGTEEYNDELKKCGTSTTFLEDDIEELDEETEENTTYSTISEDDIEEPESDFDNELSENTTSETNESTDEPTKETTLADFIHEHYFDLESIFTTYISLTDNSDEAELLEEFQKLLYQTKEAERNKARLRP
ncbi:MAG: hypothetical protein K2K02_03600, partial [Ruminococcus sp.]|nr:hypothetical protein [Ruminococcus sp.]